MKLLHHGIGAYRGGAAFGPAKWSHHDLLVIREGGIEFQTREGSLHPKAGDAIWIPPRMRFWGLSEAEQTTMWVIHFQNQGLRVADFAERLEAGVLFFRGGVESTLAMELMRRLDDVYLGEGLWETGAESYFDALFLEAKRSHVRQPNYSNVWLMDLEQWAREELPHGPGVRELAKHTRLSQSYFRQKFRREAGVSVGRFLQDLRMGQAKTLLRQSSLSLKEISAQTGYSDAIAFHRAFSKKFRITPLNYRRSCSLPI